MKKQFMILGMMMLLMIASVSAIDISTCQDFQDIDNDLTASYDLTQDIDCSDTINWNDGYGFVEIADGELFIGTIDGHGYVVDGIYMLFNDTSTNFGGGKGIINSFGGTLKNIGFTNFHLIDNTSTEGFVISSYPIVYIVEGANISSSYFQGEVEHHNSCIITGLTFTLSDSTITDSYVDVELSCYDYSSVFYFMTGAIYGVTRSNITNFYSVANFNGQTPTSAMFQDVSNLPINVINSYWDKTTSGVESSTYGTGLTTSEMYQETSYVGWDFVDTWSIEEGVSYPTLQIFAGASNTAPVINSISPDTRLELQLGDSQIYTSDVTDTDGDATYSWTIDDVEVSTGTTFIANYDDIEAGIHTLQLEVSDAEYSDSASTILEIRGVGGSSSGVSVQTSPVTNQITAQVTANNVDTTNNVVSYQNAWQRFTEWISRTMNRIRGN